MSHKMKVLLVDDEEQFRITTSKILERRGYETLMAASGAEALRSLSERPDVVILDVRMEGMDGHETLRMIKAESPDVPVIMLTGHGALPSAQASLKEGAFAYLNKPCDIDVLVAHIKDAYRVGRKVPSSEKNAEELMIPLSDYPSIKDDASVGEAIHLLKETGERIVATDSISDQGRRSLLVFDAEGELTGILTPGSLLAALRPAYLSATMPATVPQMYSMGYSAMFWSGLFTAQAKTVAENTVKDIMQEAPPSVSADANLMEVVQTMYVSNRRRLAVQREDVVVGLVREQELFFELTRSIG